MEDVVKIVIGFALVVGAVIVIVIPISFDSVEYYEYAFARQKSTGKVDLSKVYTSGKHFIGPDYEFKRFRADAHLVNIRRISAFTQDKLEVKVSARFQYYLKKRDLFLLHQAFDIHYKDLMESSAVDAIKGAVTLFTTRWLFLQRHQVEAKLHKTVRERLGGTCCPSEAECRFYESASTEQNSTEYDRVENEFACPTANNSDCDVRCEVANRGVFAEVRFFQLGGIDIPDDVENRLLKSLLLTEDAEREKLLQEAQIIRKQTNQQVRQYTNDAQEISQMATSHSNQIKVMSQANYTNVIETARSKGLKKLYTSLGITSQEHKNSFDYLRTLRGLDNVHMTVDFNQRIAGTL